MLGIKKFFEWAVAVFFLTILGTTVLSLFLGIGGFWSILLFSMIIYGSIGLPGLVATAFFWKILFKPALLIAILGPYLIFRFVIRIFVIIPLMYVGMFGKKGIQIFDDAEENIEASPKKYGILFVFFLLITSYVFFPSGLDSVTAILTSATGVLFVILLIPGILTVAVAALSFRFNVGNESGEGSGEGPDSEELKEVTKAGFEAGKEATGVYRKLDNMGSGGAKQGARQAARKAANKTAQGVNQAASATRPIRQTADRKIPAGLLNTAKKIPGFRKLVPRLASVAGGEALAVLLFALFVLVVLWIIIAGLILVILYAVLGNYVPVVLGFADAQLQLGADYGTYFGEEIGAQIPSYDLTGERNAISLAVSRLSCSFDPACFRARQENESRRPGSEATGIKFGLEITDFNIRGGSILDIRTLREKDETLPVNVEVSNPIKQGGLGIDAYNAEYRLSIHDGDTRVCSSDENGDWTTFESRYRDGLDGYIAPGDLAVSSRELESINYENCGLLQPGYGKYSEANLEIRYDYSSQATKQFEAKAAGETEPGEQERNPSETADTPVQTYINAPSPVSFRETDEGRSSEVFLVTLGYETERFDTEYRVDPESVEIDPSELVIDVDRAGVDTDRSCKDLKWNSDEEIYTLSEEKKQDIREEQSDSWYSRGFAPQAECSMILKDSEIDSISPTGETLNMRVDGNYTVKVQSEEETFETKNGNCREGFLECPVVVPESQKQEKSFENSRNDYPILRSTCSSSWSIDATRNGCTVVENQDEWGNPERINDDNEYYSNQIDNRERAYTVGNLMDRIDQQRNVQTTNTAEERFNDRAVIGLNPDNVQQVMESEKGYAIVDDSNSETVDARIEVVEDGACQSTRMTDLREKEYEDAIYLELPVSNCKQEYGEEYEEACEKSGSTFPSTGTLNCIG